MALEASLSQFNNLLPLIGFWTAEFALLAVLFRLNRLLPLAAEIDRSP